MFSGAHIDPATQFHRKACLAIFDGEICKGKQIQIL